VLVLEPGASGSTAHLLCTLLPTGGPREIVYISSFVSEVLRLFYQVPPRGATARGCFLEGLTGEAAPSANVSQAHGTECERGLIVARTV